jgi:hypothetical protein
VNTRALPDSLLLCLMPWLFRMSTLQLEDRCSPSTSGKEVLGQESLSRMIFVGHFIERHLTLWNA